METRNEPSLVTALRATEVRADGRTERKRETALREHRLDLVLDGALFSHIVCTRTDLRELVVGRLCAERLIDGAEEIAELRFSDGETRAEVRLAGERKRRPLRRLEAPPPWRSEWAFALARRFREGLPLHDETVSAHCALLACRGELLYAAEDISRHNAADKAVGHALLRGVPLSACMLFTSGRVPADMAEKAVSAGVPVLVSKAAATAEAVRLAGEYGLTLLCHAREDRYVIFDSKRI